MQRRDFTIGCAVLGLIGGVTIGTQLRERLTVAGLPTQTTETLFTPQQPTEHDCAMEHSHSAASDVRVINGNVHFTLATHTHLERAKVRVSTEVVDDRGVRAAMPAVSDANTDLRISEVAQTAALPVGYYTIRSYSTIVASSDSEIVMTEIFVRVSDVVEVIDVDSFHSESLINQGVLQ